MLVLGVGGNISQGILKALALSSLRCRVVAACISPHSMGLYTADRSYVSPRADDPRFIPWLKGICRSERIDAILSGSEYVLDVLAPAAERIRAETGAICVVSSPEVLDIGRDKLRTACWLADAELPSPLTASCDDPPDLERLLASTGFPVIAKPRYGKSGVGILRALDRAALEPVLGRADYIAQEELGDPRTEYTVGCFNGVGGEVRGAIAMRRTLEAGTTYTAEAGAFPEVRGASTRIAEALRPFGPLNVQLRVTEDGHAVPFELNIRFSGTTPMRARLGFNDVEATLRQYVLGEPPADLPLITEGLALRYWNEVYPSPGGLAALAEGGVLDDLDAHPTVVEDYGTRR